MLALKVNPPSERSIRLISGLFMFSFATSHFLSHATGLLLLDNMELVGRGVFLAPWRNTPMRMALLLCFVTHCGLGLRALYRRRHLSMPAIEAVQLGLGLLIPVLLIPHAFDVRLGYSVFGFEDSYYRVVYKYWLTQPLTGLPRQFALLLAVWTHGCIGISHVAALPARLPTLARAAARRRSRYPDSRRDGHQQCGLGRDAAGSRRRGFPRPARTASAGLRAGDRRN
jgi:adenylate cyclase